MTETRRARGRSARPVPLGAANPRPPLSHAHTTEGATAVSGEPEDDYVETDEDREAAAWFYANVILVAVRAVAARLLRGNDAQCFNTEQFCEAYHRYGVEKLKFSGDVRIGAAVAARNLRDCGTVREVEPGVWAAK